MPKEDVQQHEEEGGQVPWLRELHFQDYRDLLVTAERIGRSVLQQRGGPESAEDFMGVARALLAFGVPRKGILPEQQRRTWKGMLTTLIELMGIMDIDGSLGGRQIVEAAFGGDESGSSLGGNELPRRILSASDENVKDDAKARREHYESQIAPRVNDILHTWTSIRTMMVPGQRNRQGNSAGSEKRGKRKRGRPPQYTRKQALLLQATFDEYRQQGMDVKQAWHRTAERHGLKSGAAAKMVCHRHLKR